MSSSLLFVTIFVSSFTALTYEILWQRLLVRITGASMLSVVAIFCLFLLGLAVGTYFTSIFIKRINRPLKLYAVLEIFIASMAFLILKMCEQKTIDFVQSLPLLGLSNRQDIYVLIAAVALCILLACAAVGTCFTLIIQSLVSRKSNDISISGAYGVNLLGGALGSVVCPFILMPHLGLNGSVFCAMSLNFLLGILIYSMSEDSSTERSGIALINETACLETVSDSGSQSILGFVFLFSALSMSLEVTWTRLFCLLWTSSTYAMGAVLAIVLSGLALGSYVVARKRFLLSNLNGMPRLILASSLGCALFIVLTIHLLPYASWFVLWCQMQLTESFVDIGTLTWFLPWVLILLMLVFPLFVLMGIVTPALLEVGILAARESFSYTKAVGAVIGLSTIGSSFGALITTIFVIPNDYFYSGIESAFIGCFIFFTVIAAYILLFQKRFLTLSFRSAIAGLLLLTVFFIVMRPDWNPTLMSIGASFVAVKTSKFPSYDKFKQSVLRQSEACLFYKEGQSSTITVERNKTSNVVSLKSNGKTEAALPIELSKSSLNADLSTPVLLGALPLDSFSQLPKDSLQALVIGFGSGITSGAMLCSPLIQKLTVCEVEPVIYKCESCFEKTNFVPFRNDWLLSGRITPLCEDARFFLNQTDKKFDVIVSQPSEPWVNGASDLYTLEFFRLAQTRMTHGARFSQWIQLYNIDSATLLSLLSTFKKVFPFVQMVHPEGSGEVIILGSLEPLNSHPVSSQDLQNSLCRISGLDRSQVFKCDLVLNSVDIDKLCGANPNIEINTDGRLVTEYKMPTELTFTESCIDRNLAMLKTALQD